MTRSSTKRHGRKYSAYVCGRVLKQGAAACPGSRAPAGDLEQFVVERIRAVGRDPSVLKEAVTADQETRETRKPELEAEVRRLGEVRGRLEAERQNVENAIAEGATGMADRLRKLEAQLAEESQSLADARRDLEGLDAGAIDVQDLKRTLAEFEPLWAGLSTPERARVLAQLLERVTFDAESGEVEIKFRPGAPRLLAQTTCSAAGTVPADGQATH